MKAKVEMVYEGNKPTRKVKVTIKDGLKGTRLMNAIEKAIEKQEAGDREWTRWNLLDLTI